MKMNYIKICSLLLIIVFVCSACNGTITRNIRHNGFSVGEKFICDGFYPEEKEDTSYTKIRYFTGSHLIDENGKIYELSIGKVFQNGQNCKSADTNIVVKTIMDYNIVRGEDNKYYYLNGQNDVKSYSEITSTDKDYFLYDLLLKPMDVVKVITADSNLGLYYILKTDGNVYGYNVTREDRDSPLEIVGVNVVYDKNDYGSNIIDFNYAGESLNTYIKTEDKVYRMIITNSSECKKYADVRCIYEIKEDSMFDEYKDKIIMYNGSSLITDYKQIFNVES